MARRVSKKILQWGLIVFALAMTVYVIGRYTFYALDCVQDELYGQLICSEWNRFGDAVYLAVILTGAIALFTYVVRSDKKFDDR